MTENLTRQGINGAGEFCYSTIKRGFAEFEVCESPGFNQGRSIVVGLHQRGEMHWLCILDDDDLHLAEDFTCAAAALDAYLKFPTIVSWGWIISTGFQY